MQGPQWDLPSLLQAELQRLLQRKRKRRILELEAALHPNGAPQPSYTPALASWAAPPPAAAAAAAATAADPAAALPPGMLFNVHAFDLNVHDFDFDWGACVCVCTGVFVSVQVYMLAQLFGYASGWSQAWPAGARHTAGV